MTKETNLKKYQNPFFTKMQSYVTAYIQRHGLKVVSIESEVLLYLRQYSPVIMYKKELNRKLNEIVQLYQQRCEGPIKLRVEEVLDCVEV